MERFFAAAQARDGAAAKRVMEDALEWTLSYLLEDVHDADLAAGAT